MLVPPPSWASCSRRADGWTKWRRTGCSTSPRRSTRHIGSTGQDLARVRISMDRNVFEAVAAGTARRIVYVATISRGRAINARPITEDELPAPCDADRWRTSAPDCLEGYVLAGLPIVTGIPGCIYGSGGWFRERVVEPVMAGRRVWLTEPAGQCVSPIHVRDCARALVHLAERGERGRRYFIANSEPTRIDELAGTFARVADRRLRVWHLPAAARVITRRRAVVCRLGHPAVEHPPARDRLSIRVSHRRRGMPPDPEDTSWIAPR